MEAGAPSLKYERYADSRKDRHTRSRKLQAESVDSHLPET